MSTSLDRILLLEITIVHPSFIEGREHDFRSPDSTNHQGKLFEIKGRSIEGHLLDSELKWI